MGTSIDLIFDYIISRSIIKLNFITGDAGEREMENHTSDYRVEKDSIGTKDVPANVYYGVQSLRAAENFPTSE